MSTEYTPTTKQVRAAWNALTEAENERYRERGVGLVTEEESNAEFDRWLNQVKADAWDEGHRTNWVREPSDCQCYAYSSSECGCGLYGTGALVTPNPYREADHEDH